MKLGMGDVYTPSQFASSGVTAWVNSPACSSWTEMGYLGGTLGQSSVMTQPWIVFPVVAGAVGYATGGLMTALIAAAIGFMIAPSSCQYCKFKNGNLLTNGCGM